MGVLKTHESTRKLARRDALHKLTTALASQHRTVVIEELNVAANSMTNRPGMAAG